MFRIKNAEKNGIEVNEVEKSKLISLYQTLNEFVLSFNSLFEEINACELSHRTIIIHISIVLY